MGINQTNYTFPRPPLGVYSIVCGLHTDTRENSLMMVHPVHSMTSCPLLWNIVTIEALHDQFTTTSLDFPVQQGMQKSTTYVIVFKNFDARPHNIAVYSDPEWQNPVFHGSRISAPNASVSYSFSRHAAAGDYYPGRLYYYRDDALVTMNGTIRFHQVPVC